MHDIDTIVIGAGVVGLATAQQLASNGIEVLVLDANPIFGAETSSRHSEVIHAGIYYRKNSLKAQLCVRGKQLLYDYCRKHHVPHKRIEKLIVATSSEQEKQLHSIAQHAEQNGVHDLQTLNSKQVAELEPSIKANSALLSPSTGIVDSHAYMLSLVGSAESAGAMFAFNSSVNLIEANEIGFVVHVNDSDATKISAKRVVNAAGHGACTLATSITALDQQFVPTPLFAKGNYFRLQGSVPVSRLIYPVPEPGGLGVHITLDMAGQARFGPDVQWQHSLDYQVDDTRADSFYEAVRRYWPQLEDNALVADYAGVRPKITFNAEPYDDFVIQDKQTHQIDGLVNLFGIDSPGLTSSLAIGERVAALVQSE